MSDNQDKPTGISRTPVHLLFNKKRRAAYKDGQLAYVEDVHLENNPYDDESLAKEWRQGWEAASYKRQKNIKKQKTHWVLIIIPPLLLIPLYFYVDSHVGIRSCGIIADYIWVPSLACVFGGVNTLRRLPQRLLSHRQDRRLYRSLLTVAISVPIMFHYSQLTERMDQHIASFAEEVQAHCVSHGTCPSFPYYQSFQHWGTFWYKGDGSTFEISYCLGDDKGSVSWIGGVQSKLMLKGAEFIQGRAYRK